MFCFIVLKHLNILCAASCVSCFLVAFYSYINEQKFWLFYIVPKPAVNFCSLDLVHEWKCWLISPDFICNPRCVFLPDNGAFFVNYVIASAFIGNAMDLLRIPGLLMYMIRLCLARSAAERRNVKRVRRDTHANLSNHSHDLNYTLLYH